ncbi:hypothetical protein [Paraburkholderia bannensis]|uniref:hypothetical protein n=1 Tax=Paraburkholderia bannensis TaxID=765414 RepID=UPI0012EBD9DE|nr:hypothetical protein [Paraburkholderia bannensis]
MRKLTIALGAILATASVATVIATAYGGLPTPTQQAASAVGMANPTPRCREVKNQCIEHCHKVLPTTDFGTTFDRCMQACEDGKGCPHGLSSGKDPDEKKATP